jgi:hypothetical protein
MAEHDQEELWQESCSFSCPPSSDPPQAEPVFLRLLLFCLKIAAVAGDVRLDDSGVESLTYAERGVHPLLHMGKRTIGGETASAQCGVVPMLPLRRRPL